MKTPEYEVNNEWIESHDALVTRVAKREALLAAAEIAKAHKDFAVERAIFNLAMDLK